MKEINGKFQYNGKEYPLVFNLNVMERIQEEYGTLEKWGELTDGKSGEPNAKAIIYGFTEMINEGIDIQNEESEEKQAYLTLKQVGRLITNYGLTEATKVLNNTVVESTQSNEKNA